MWRTLLGLVPLFYALVKHNSACKNNITLFLYFMGHKQLCIHQCKPHTFFFSIHMYNTVYNLQRLLLKSPTYLCRILRPKTDPPIEKELFYIPEKRKKGF
jgi:hypothetical protein